MLLSTNKLIRSFISKKQIKRGVLQLYGSAALFITQCIFSDIYKLDIDEMIYFTDYTYNNKEYELAIIDILNTVDWKVEMIPYSIYLDDYIRKYYQSDSKDYDYVMKISEVVIMDILLHDNSIIESLHQLSYYIVEMVIYYKFKKNMIELYLYSKASKIFNFIDTYEDIDTSSSLIILVKYLKS